MSWEDFKKKGYYLPPVSYKEENTDPKTGLIEKWDEYPGFRWFAEERPCDTPNHKIFQEECKLGTLSGKFEFVSESLLYWEPDDEIRTPIAQYKDSWEGHKSMSADKYPYQMISPHPRFDYHTHYQQHATWLWEIPQNRKIVNGKGTVLCCAHITRRVMPETIHAYTSSGIYNPVKYGEISADKGGCVNILTPGRLMGDYIPAMVPNSCNIDICKAEPDPNPGQGFEHILEAVDAQQMFRCEKTSAEADWLFGEKEAK